MDESRARELLAAQRAETEALLQSVHAEGQENRQSEDEQDADVDDPAQPLTQQGIDDAVEESLRARLDAIDRAEQRLANGTYGRSVRSGDPIPDARLEVDPSAELTVEEAKANPDA
jgi:DnaK suppressor protein